MDEKKKERLKIGLFVDAFFPMVDGVVNVVDNYAKRLQAIADVTVFAPQARDKAYQDQTSYKVVRSRQVHVPFTDYDMSIPLFDPRFKNMLNRANLDIVHIHSPFPIGQIGIQYAKKHKIPVIATFHSQYRQDYLERVKSKTITDIAIRDIMHTFNKCDAYFAVNKKVAAIFVTYGAKKQPGILFNGTDLLPIEETSKIHELRTTHGIQPEEKVLLFVGRIDKVKNIFFMANALAELKKRQFAYKMLFIGSGPHEKELKKTCGMLGIQDECLFLGKIMDRQRLSTYYALADLFLFPSLYDSSSLVQIEAASQKTPTLFLEGAATADTVTKDVNGYLSPPDSKSYAETIIDIFADETHYQRVSKQAFKDLYWTWDEAVDKAYQTYLDMIANKRGG